MTLADESEIEAVERLIREAEDQLARQREVVERLPPSGEVADMARTLLAQYEEALSLHVARLARLREDG